MSAHKWQTIAVTACTFVSLLGCADDSPSNASQSNVTVPHGVTLVRSALSQDKTPSASAAQVSALGASNRAFAFALYEQLAKQPGNLFFSPFSISEALAMAYAGARSSTASEMRDALHFQADAAALHAAFNATGVALAARRTEVPPMASGDGFELTIVNQAWADKDTHFLDSYLDVLAQNYGAGLFLADFAGDPDGVRVVINDWVAQQTHDRITDLLAKGSIDARVALVLTNAIYFKASWLKKLDPAKTKTESFHAAGGDRSVPMMHQQLEADYRETASYQAVRLPYLSDSMHMLLILPAAGKLDAVVQELRDAPEQITSGFESYNVTLALPRFSFDSAPQLKPALRALGMQEAFTTAADFSGLDGQKDLFVRDVVHKAFVAVDETGTEAAASTAVIFGRKSITPSAQVTLDRPFIFLVYDEPTDTVLFLGQLLDPG